MAFRGDRVYVWLYYSILVSLIFPFMATAAMTHRSLERRFHILVHLAIWLIALLIVNYVGYRIVDDLFHLTSTILLGPLQPQCVETSTVVCITAYIIAWVIVTLLSYKGSWSSKLMVSFIYALIGVASVVAIDSIYIHCCGFDFPDLVFETRTKIHIVATLIIYIPLIFFLPPRIRNMISRTGGRMAKYLPIPIVLFCVFFGEFYHMLHSGGINELDSHYTHLILVLCVLCLILLLASLSGSISVDRYRRELDAATVVQNSCLPDPDKLPEVPFAEVSAHITPAKEVGGDFYDIRRMDDGNLMFVVADVSDKGIPAALFMMKSKVLLEDAIGFGYGPAESLDWINRRLMSGNESFMFVSMILGTLSPSGELRISCAGHPSPLLRHDGEVSGIEVARGPLLGLMEGEYTDTVVQMSEGDAVLMFTDGATDAENLAGEMFGEERLSLAFSRSEGPDISADVVSVIRRFSSSADQFDDLTVLAFRYTGRS